ncbi:rhamnan synthesis F family protein [Paracoccus haeundaensis]|uniref:rhamnan synthesis F family protein n=1 Tax=Paracoccus haeundaensis TaxID=225362 RepID=UPI00159ECC6E|nr:rhamnan synthesis F family protein [Paracoccus haeundaensis]
MTASLEGLSGGPKWRGHFDGVRADGILHGWAFLAADPAAPVELDLYIHDVHLASTRTDVSRTDIDRILAPSGPLRTGFWFTLNDFRREGALDLLRKFGHILPKVNLRDDLRICIAGTQHRLPGAHSHEQHSLNLEPHLPALLQAAVTHLQDGLTGDQISIRDQEILLAANPLFSAEWYDRTHGEVALSGIDPVEHFVRLSSVLERAPGPWFDTAGYLAALPAGQKPALPPVLHYAIHGHDSWWPGQGRFREPSDEETGHRDYAVLIHLYHLDTVPDLQLLIRSFPETVDIFITVPEGSAAHDPKVMALLFPRATQIMTVPNQGQDVAAFLETVRRLKGRGYRFFCKLHSKKGNTYPETWRRVMFDALAATPARVAQTVELFRTNPRVLMAGPEQFWLNGSDFDLGGGQRLRAFATDLGLGVLTHDWGFFAGTCFWIDAELAGLISEKVPMTAFDEVKAPNDVQASRAVERLFGLVCMAVGGQVALSDGYDWTSAPKLSNRKAPGLRLPVGEQPWQFLSRRVREMQAPKIVPRTALQPKQSDPDDLFAEADVALHGAIDVMVCCWNGRPELLQRGLGDLGRQLEQLGLTWGMLVSSSDVQHEFQAASCRNVVMDTLHLRFPPSHPDVRMFSGADLPDPIALSLLRSEHLFRKTDLPEGKELRAALADIADLHAYWRGILTRHKVKMFLIWGNTAPKSRLFIHLCTELGIEYQIIERGHFPGTLSIDPMGQFGTGVLPRLVSHASATAPVRQDPEARFQEIRAWYDAQQDHAAYAQFQKRGTRDLDIMARARAQKRPVILVIGGNDQGGGVVTPDPDPLRVNWFGSSDEAFAIIRGLVSAKFPDALLVLRPHPSQAAQSIDFVLVARETALDDLIDAADLCITVGSTSRAICLLKDKPLLSLGLTELDGLDLGVSVPDATHLLAAIRRHVWSDFAEPYPGNANRRVIADMFDHHLVGINASVPTRHRIQDLAQLLAGRIQRMKTGFLQDHEGREDQISQAMFEDVRDRGRAIFPVDRLRFAGRPRPPISVVLPIYGDYEGTRICFDQLVRYQAENGYRVITVWDRGPDTRLRDLCLEYAEKAGFTYLENSENVGFSGTVNSGILHAGRDDIILLNSDTVPCGDWALRLQDAAYAHPKIASVVPFSNNATIYNVPYLNGMRLPAENPVAWAETLDTRARSVQPFAVEMPVSHGYCTFVKRSMYDRLGLYDEVKFGIGQSEDNEFSLRARMAGFFCVCPTNVVMAHAGSTSFGDEVGKWLENGRAMLRKEFSHYFAEIGHFLKLGDPLDRFRRQIVDYAEPPTEADAAKSETTP